MTTREVAKYLRISEDRIRALIRKGELGAIDTAPNRFGRPRFVVLPHHLAEWEKSRRVATPPPKPKRKKRTVVKDYYPD
jgi:excisionase family DNA binding protein